MMNIVVMGIDRSKESYIFQGFKLIYQTKI